MGLIREFEIKEGIYSFDSDLDPSRSAYDSRILKDYEENESKHFWFGTRRDKICNLFDEKVSKDSKILEIGGGTGFVASGLKHLGFSIEMADIHFNGLKYAQEKGIEKLYQFDLYNPPFSEEFDVICLFDVLEHQSDDIQAIECLKRMLKPGGKIILTVPAHSWLWNRDDHINGHYRRYTKKMLVNLCRQCSLRSIHLEYFFIFIVPFLLLRSYVNRDCSKQVDKNEKLKMDLSRGMNAIFYLLTKFEFSVARALPNVVGGSLCLIAEK